MHANRFGVHPQCDTIMEIQGSAGPRYLGYTVNGRVYNISEDLIPDISAGSLRMQEVWLKNNGYAVVDEIDSKWEAITKRDLSR